MDIHMPEMDGYTATRELRNTHKDLLVIAQTSFGMDSDRDKALQAGCNDYISKPIDPKALDQLILKHAVNKASVNRSRIKSNWSSEQFSSAVRPKHHILRAPKLTNVIANDLCPC